ncbi:MAG TPA: type II CAAX endopeptidase family protein [Candidatus Saccharimonadales bacterium]
MSANYLDKIIHKVSAWKWIHSRWVLMLLFPAWVTVSLFLSLGVVWVLVYALSMTGIAFATINTILFNAAVAAAIYIFALAIAIGVPWLFKKYTTSKELGLQRLPTWADIGLAPVGFIIYFIASGLLVYVASQIIGFDVSQIQDTGFTRLSRTYEYTLAFLTLIVVAPVAEELLFRGFLYGKLRKYLPIWVSMLVTSLLFGVFHGQWNVGVDVFALSLVLCGLREVTGSVWAGLLLHIIKNSIAFFIVFISPML